MKKLPRGFFEFTDSEGNTIKGRVCTWSLNRFCEKMDIKNVTEMFQALTTGISIAAVAELILCAVEYSFKGKDCPYKRDEALDWIDDIGGIDKTVEFINSTMLVSEDESEKKSENIRVA